MALLRQALDTTASGFAALITLILWWRPPLTWAAGGLRCHRLLLPLIPFVHPPSRGSALLFSVFVLFAPVLDFGLEQICYLSLLFRVVHVVEEFVP